ncbi:MAG: hypothetical protein IKT43_05420 [Clostridia bacterium]|nr:hypothetical protein [Clostridia bacterium]
MDFVLYGTDARLSFLARQLIAASHRVLSWNSVEMPRVQKIESPLVLCDAVRLILPFRVSEDVVKTALGTLPLGSHVYGGKAPKSDDLQALLARRALTWHDLTEDDDYCRENAVPTAEGALAKLISSTPKCLSSLSVCIFGAGRVAEALIDLLARLGCSITVCARREKVLAAVRRAGHEALALPLDESALERLTSMDALINTVPAKDVVSRTVLSRLKKDAPVLELASGEENCDKDAAAEYAHPLFILPALPGKVAPHCAARALFHAITQKG